QALAHGERIEPDSLVEAAVDSPNDPVAAGELRKTDDGRPGGALLPVARLLICVEYQRETLADTGPQLVDDPGIEEQPRRERVGKHEPERHRTSSRSALAPFDIDLGPPHDGARAPRASAIRSASDAPSSPWKRGASVG